MDTNVYIYEIYKLKTAHKKGLTIFVADSEPVTGNVTVVSEEAIWLDIPKRSGEGFIGSHCIAAKDIRGFLIES